ncbi:LAMI_0F12200g1_1 [Lachancea mirantina]|uniref:tRNA(adenine(34)) deaminase n=1 Tax=Lachancea mirantina TaxID=1230905 RepID=A0A1G4K319_9SACH|nr:LAMI_0F12200g1_1 [Lachancea mirantina]
MEQRMKEMKPITGNDWQHMRTATKLARYALDHDETPVACIFVHTPTNQILAYGLNDTNKSLTGVAHAEFMGIAQIQRATGAHDREIYKDITLYVTVEPCIMCASALKQLGLRRVVFGCGNERFGGNGSILSIHSDESTAAANKYSSVPGLLRKEAILLLRYFYVRENERSPNPRVKAERKLDLETFPPMEWSRYVDRDEFMHCFGAENVRHFDDKTDLRDQVEWGLIDEPHDKVLELIQRQCDAFRLHTAKKFKS